MAAEWTAALGVLLIPVFLVVFAASHGPETAGAVQTIATEAARAGAQSDSCRAGKAAATSVIKGPTGNDGLAAQLLHVEDPEDPTVEIDGSKWGAGGVMKVTVSANIRLFGVETPISVTRSHSEPIDQYRFLDGTPC